MTFYKKSRPSTNRIAEPVTPTSTPEPGTSLSDIQEYQLRWLWEQRVLRGKITLLDGDPDLGKSLITLDLAARVTTGKPMPDGTPGIQGNVILIAPEDDASDTIKPRILAAGGDPSRVRLLTIFEKPGAETGQVNYFPLTLPSQFATLVQSVKSTHAVLVIIDPLIAVLDRKFSASRDQDMRHVLSSLAFLAQYTDCAILLVRHLNKGSLHNPLYRGSGSIGIIASARSGLLVVRDPSDENKRILTTTKNNLSIKAPNLTYNITSNSDGIPTINWLGTSHIPLTHLLKNTSSLSSGRQIIISLLHESDIPLGPKEIAEQTGQVGSQVRLILRRMLNSQEIISPAYGLYTVHGHRSLKTPSLYQKTTSETLETVSHFDSNLPDTGETPETLETLETVSHFDSNLPDTGETPETPETLETVNDLGSNLPDTGETPETPETLETVNDLGSNLPDTGETPETPETLETVNDLGSNLPDTGETPETPETLETVNDLGSNSTPIPVAPAPAQPPPITQTTLDALTKKIRTLFYCTHDIHYVQWLIFNTKIGCPICDGWLVRDIINDPTVLGLFETLNKHAPRENEHRRAWLERIAPFIPLEK